MKYKYKVIPGKGRGKKLGFPTLNLKIPKNFSLNQGVYTCWVWIEGKKYCGALHFGPNSTFYDKNTSLEVYVIDFPKNKTVKNLTVKTAQYLRASKQFSSPKNLQSQIKKDIQLAQKYLYK